MPKEYSWESSKLIDSYERARSDDQLAVLEGLHPVIHAIRFDVRFINILITNPDSIRELVSHIAADVTEKIMETAEIISPEIFAKLTRPRAPIPTGIIAIAQRPIQSIEKLINDRSPAPILLLENPRDLGNMGAAIRVAAALEAAGVIIIGGEHDPWHPAAIRGSAGLHFALPVIHTNELPTTDRPLVILDPDEGEPLTIDSIPARAILAFGGERHGLSENLVNKAAKKIRIPMHQGVTSLNLATSAAITLYAWHLGKG